MTKVSIQLYQSVSVNGQTRPMLKGDWVNKSSLVTPSCLNFGQEADVFLKINYANPSRVINAYHF